MILFNLDLLRYDPMAFLRLMVITAVSLLVAITFHEASHALSASRLGDNTAKSLGRLSLNPLKHLDPMGTLMLFLVGFGWGKPVPVNPLLLRGDMRRGMALVSIFGPIANLVIAFLFALPIRFGLLPLTTEPVGTLESVLGTFVIYIMLYNLLLAFFNLIPIAPLDGFKVALGILPRSAAIAYSRTEQYGPFILLAIIALGYVTSISLFSIIIFPVINFFAQLLIGQPFF